MNYVAEIAAFYSWAETHPIDPASAVLWHAFMYIAGSADWPEWFTAKTSLILARTNLSRSAVYRAIQELRSVGRIKLIKQGGRSGSQYHIIPFCVPNRDASWDVNALVEKPDTAKNVCVPNRDASWDANSLANKPDTTKNVCVPNRDASWDANSLADKPDTTKNVCVPNRDASWDENSLADPPDTAKNVCVPNRDASWDTTLEVMQNGGAIGGSTPVLVNQALNSDPPKAPHGAVAGIAAVRPNGRRERLSKADKSDLPHAQAMIKRLWGMYPAHAQEGLDKLDAKAALYLYREIGEDQLQRCLKRFKQRMAGTQRENSMYPSAGRFFTGGYVDYLDAVFNPDSVQLPPAAQSNAQRHKPLNFDYEGQRHYSEDDLNRLYTDWNDLKD